VDALEVGEVACHHGEQVVILARHEVAGDDGGRLDHRLLEGVEQVLTLALQTDVHDHGHAEIERVGVDLRLVALDHARLLEGADAARDGGRRKRNALGELNLAQARIFEQGGENGPIERV